ncbi:uncharacterized protein LOC105390218 [Plutella xylostella]|uniref:uncharacterized protein LOC105390218 n=1 Tax=Plutella xylostella TaxID=51655 RepID=UPI0020325316|nr:uncharacterized protein LOC105390218 [Plutella xylostella]
MEEELNEDELEERLYAMIHYADDSQQQVEPSGQNDSLEEIVAGAPRSTVRRYWRTSGDAPPNNNPFQKVNNNRDVGNVSSKTINTPTNKTVDTPSNKTVNTPSNKTVNTPSNNEVSTPTVTDKPTMKPLIQKPKEEKKEVKESPPPSTVDMSIFSSPITCNIKTTVKNIENDTPVFHLESSDEDEVIEVELPPKQTITIESSDEDELTVVNPPHSQQSPNKPEKAKTGKRAAEDDASQSREVSASPVPSVVSSVSDEFIRGDCIAWNISSRRPDNPSFDFSLHGSDLLDTPSRSKKKKKNKDKAASTPQTSDTPTVLATPPKKSNETECFATPKNKSKSKKRKSKTYAVSEHSIPNADVYDSDSNQSVDQTKKNSYSVTDKSLPNPDVYESDSSQSSVVRSLSKNLTSKPMSSPSSSDAEPQPVAKKATGGAPAAPTPQRGDKETSEIVDLTDDSVVIDNVVNVDDTIEENIVMANVTGFEESSDYDDHQSESLNPSSGRLGSTKVPAILSEDLDFDNLKRNEKVCKKRRYSVTTLRADMEKFYNESWGGEDFNHKEILKTMSRDKSLWEIDPKDRMPTPSKRKITCNYCNRVGHRDDTCRQKPAVCHMCGGAGHYEPRCPNKICVNCGTPNYMYSTSCGACHGWAARACAECGQAGHAAAACPDLWRRYHHTIDNNTPLVQLRGAKKHSQQYCSGCARRGHLVHCCRLSLPFSGLPINSPYVVNYRPLYPPTHYQHPFVPQAMTPKNFERNKRQSKSPMVSEGPVSKKRNMSITEDKIGSSPAIDSNRKSIDGEPRDATPRARVDSENTPVSSVAEESSKAPDYIRITPASANNHDKQGQMIQDNEVSDTSDVVTSARIYVSSDIIDKLKTDEGQAWVTQTSQEHGVTVSHSEVNCFLNIKGKFANQEAFQTALRDWTNTRPVTQSQSTEAVVEIDDQSYLSDNIPKNKNNVLRKLRKAFESLKEDIGDPKKLFSELNYFRTNHSKLLKQRVISPKQLHNSKTNINEMLKKLNMVLLGQAGLADGPAHLRELHALQEKITNFRNKNIPLDLRKEVGQHFHSIFTATPRDDYQDLLDKYYVSRQTPKISKKQKKAFKMPKIFNPSQPMQDNRKGETERQGGGDIKRVRVAQKTMSKLTFFHRRLVRAQPINAGLKKARTELVRKLHKQISAMDSSEQLNAKTLKKMKKLQAQAGQFLRNNVM